MDECELGDREAEQVDAQRRAVAGDRIAGTAEEGRLLHAVPRRAGVVEAGQLHGWNGGRVDDAERPEERQAQLDVPDREAAAEQTVELVHAPGGQLADVERAGVV